MEGEDLVFLHFFRKYFFSSDNFFQPFNLLSVISVMLGTCVLFVTLTFMNSYATTVESQMKDFFGDALLEHRQGSWITQSPGDIFFEAEEDLQKVSPYIHSKGVLTHKGQIKGILIEGIPSETPVMRLDFKMLEGDFSLAPDEIIVGKELAKELGLKVGSQAKLLLIKGSELSQSPSAFPVKVSGLIDYGQHSHNSRYALVNLNSLRTYLQLPKESASGFRMLLKESLSYETFQNKHRWESYYLRSWKDLAGNLFQAVEYEKVILLFLLSVLLLVAAFNLSISLFVGTLKRSSDISILKALGASSSYIFWLFSLQGLGLGVTGLALGALLSFFIIHMVFQTQDMFPLLPEDVYQLSEVVVHWEFSEMALISLFVLILCWVCVLFPVRMALKKSIVEGLSVE